MLRLSWSPDGHYLVSAHAMNNSGPTAQIIEREGWKTNMDFVGHRKAVTVVVSALGLRLVSCHLHPEWYPQSLGSAVLPEAGSRVALRWSALRFSTSCSCFILNVYVSILEN